MAANCAYCRSSPAKLRRPATGDLACKECFFTAFENEVHQTIINYKLFNKQDKVAIAVSGGKDSTVLAHILTYLNKKYDYGLNLFLLAVDEGITGYRDDSLESVKLNEKEFKIPLIIISYEELYGWRMDDIVKVIGHKNNCTYCGVFRRQALDRAASMMNADVLCTGHNVDDAAETALMNLFRGDIGRLGRCSDVITGRQDKSKLPRCKPLMYSYEKEIVLYAHFKKLNFFSTECIYSPNAYRGYAREFIKKLEATNPQYIAGIIKSISQFTVPSSIATIAGECTRCGWMSSNILCKACVLLESLENKNPLLATANKKKREKILEKRKENVNSPILIKEEEGRRKRIEVAYN